MAAVCLWNKSVVESSFRRVPSFPQLTSGVWWCSHLSPLCCAMIWGLHSRLGAVGSQLPWVKAFLLWAEWLILLLSQHCQCTKNYEQRLGSFTPKLLSPVSSGRPFRAGNCCRDGLAHGIQDISGWRGATRIGESNSLLLAGLLKTKP